MPFAVPYSRCWEALPHSPKRSVLHAIEPYDLTAHPVTFAEPSSGTEAVASRSTTPARTPPSLTRRSHSPSNYSIVSGVSGTTSHSSSIPIDPLLQDSYSNAHSPYLTPYPVSDDASSVVGAPVPGPAIDTWPPVQWPFETYQEALLMQHYSDEIACWFDFVDGATHFVRNIPEMAVECTSGTSGTTLIC